MLTLYSFVTWLSVPSRRFVSYHLRYIYRLKERRRSMGWGLGWVSRGPLSCSKASFWPSGTSSTLLPLLQVRDAGLLSVAWRVQFSPAGTHRFSLSLVGCGSFFLQRAGHFSVGLLSRRIFSFVYWKLRFNRGHARARVGQTSRLVDECLCPPDMVTFWITSPLTMHLMIPS